MTPPLSVDWGFLILYISVMMSHEYIIKKVFETFFEGVKYVIEPETSYRYLYNIKLENVNGCYFNEVKYIPEYKFEGTNNVFNEDDFVIVLRNFAPILNGSILIYGFINNRNRIIVTPDQIRNENYGIISRIKDPFKNRFDLTNKFIL